MFLERKVSLCLHFLLLTSSQGAEVHMIGIGGISMSALAEILLYFGYHVTGSDMQASALTEKLQQNGAQITIGQRAENIRQPDLVCYTAAISEQNPELQAARAAGVPLLNALNCWAPSWKNINIQLRLPARMAKRRRPLCWRWRCWLQIPTRPCWWAAACPQIGGNYRIGGNVYLPFEACEYVESFLHFKPYVSIITNVEEDHLDYFTNLNHIISSFGKFASLTSPSGCIIVCSDDENACKVVQNVQRNIIYYGIDSPKADFTAQKILTDRNGLPSFTVCKGGMPLVDLSLRGGGQA